MTNRLLITSGNYFSFPQGILYKSSKKKKRMAVAFVVFENVEQVRDAIKVPSLMGF